MKPYVLFIVLGVCLIGQGYSQLGHAARHGSNLVQVDLSELERGAVVRGGDVVVGKHYRLFSHATCSMTRLPSQGPNSSTQSIRYTYYPIISASRSYWARRPESSRAADGTPGAAGSEPPANYAMLVKSADFRDVASIPLPGEWCDRSTGLAGTVAERLSEEERGLISKIVPERCFGRVLVLEPVRDQASVSTGVILIVRGIGFVCAGALLLRTAHWTEAQPDVSTPLRH